jgi:hypothetical protein
MYQNKLLPVGRGFMPDETKLECSLESQEVVPSTSIPRAVVDSGSGESSWTLPRNVRTSSRCSSLKDKQTPYTVRLR